MPLYLPCYVSFVIDKLINSGYEAYAVGGCVRDMLSGVVPNDYDVTTNALPEGVKALFDRTVDTGIKHGTVTVLSDGKPVEVTTFRTESGYADSRHPDKVEFVNSLKEDLSRRDFTVNAMAYNERAGLVDYFGGKADLKNKILRTVGDPDVRFSEDALRILRLFRFGATLGFAFDKDTERSALALSDGLKKVSVERVRSELIKALGGDNLAALSGILGSGALSFAGLTKDNLSPVAALPKGRLRLFAFLYFCGEDCLSSADILKLSNKEKRYISDMLCLISEPPEENAVSVKHALTEYDAVFEDYLLFLRLATGENTERKEEMYKSIIERGEPYKISHLAVTGDDLAAAGISGRDTGDKLLYLLDAVITDPTVNTKTRLLELLI